MENYGFKGVAYIATNFVETSGHMTVFQLQELKAAGWKTGSHTASHVGKPSATELSTSKQWLITI